MSFSTLSIENLLTLSGTNPEEAYRLAAELNPQTNYEHATKEYLSGNYYFEKENFPEALPYLASALHRLETEFPVLYRDTCALLVRIYRKIGDSPYAASLLRSCIENLENRGQEALTIPLFLTLGEIYMSTHNFVEALRNFKILYRQSAKQDDRYMMSEALFRIGNAYNWNEQLAEAEDHLNQSKEMKLKEGFDPSWVIASLGILYTKTKDLERSLQHFKECLTLCGQNGDVALKCNVMKSMGNLYNLMGEPDQAIDILQQGLPIAAKIPHKTVMMLSHQFLSEAYKRKKDFENALKHYEEYFRLNEEIKRSSTDVQLKGMQLMQLKYDVDEARKESEIYKLKNIDLANAFREIERQKQELGNKNREITDSIIYAQRIQHAILPPSTLFNRNISEHFILFMPKDIVSGDFYWASEYGNSFIFAAVDCTGHGVPGAFLSLIAHNLLNQAVNELGIHRPDAILQYLHKGVHRTFLGKANEQKVKDSMDIALCSWNRESRTLEYAGVFNPLYRVSQGQLTEIKADRVSLGDGSNFKFALNQVTVEKDDFFYIFTDGYADQFGGPLGKKLKYRTFKEYLALNSLLVAEEQKGKLTGLFNDWKGEREQVDDICVIGFKP
jgi:serine phosphatase RsbU (regulator of sigma subunit)